ncbi:hypothetical protein [Treponema saccharophilum]|uniref:hypothetical protein n=1 Tax=Treponema saccharophilum TaxID=165 RepID=UPI001146B8AF|nr:hypothetical protein [Treponema saccharophilum]
MKLSRRNALIISILASVSFISEGCFGGGEKSSSAVPDIEIMQIPQRSGDHFWYSFVNGGFVQTSLPQNSAIQSMKPWTESVRISDADTGLDGNGYLLVNHIGALVFEKKATPTLINDRQLLSRSTASNLIFSGGNAYFTLSRNSLFNSDSDEYDSDEPGSIGSNRPYLVRISTENKLFYPCVTYGDLGIGSDEEISGSYFDGTDWISSIKFDGRDDVTGKEKVSFRYIKWNSLRDFAALSAQTQDGKISSEECVEEQYRAPNTPSPFSAAPLRLRELLSPIPDSFDFTVTLRVPGGDSPRYFSHGPIGSSTNANAIISDGWICAVFADGTTYFAGAVDGRNVINNGKTVAFRLPRLPKNYFYSNFCISGDCLVVGWEENDFYKTGRSGFITVDMAELFYK